MSTLIKNKELINFLLQKKNTTLENFLKKFKINISSLQNLRFTDYRYNILQLSVYFLNFNLILSIFKEKQFFNFLNYECFKSNDSLWDICISKQNIRMFEFLFDKVNIPLKNKKITFKNEKKISYKDNPLFYIHKDDFIYEIYLWIFKWKKENDLNEISIENLVILEKFFHIVKDNKFENIKIEGIFEKNINNNNKQENNYFENEKINSIFEKRRKYNISESTKKIKKFEEDNQNYKTIKKKKKIIPKIENSFVMENISKNKLISTSKFIDNINNEKIDLLEEKLNQNLSENSKSNSSFLEENIYFIQKLAITKKKKKKKKIKFQKENEENIQNLHIKDLKKRNINSKQKSKNKISNIHSFGTKNFVAVNNNKIFSFKNMKKLKTNTTQDFFNKENSYKFIKEKKNNESSTKFSKSKENSSQFIKKLSSQFFKEKNNRVNSIKYLRRKNKRNSSKFFKEEIKNNENNKFLKEENLNKNSDKFLEEKDTLKIYNSYKPINKLKINFFQQIFQSKNDLICEEI